MGQPWSFPFHAAESRWWQPDTLLITQKILSSPPKLGTYMLRGSGIGICCRLARDCRPSCGWLYIRLSPPKKERPASSPRAPGSCFERVQCMWFQKWGRWRAHGDLATSLLSSPSPCCSSRLHLPVCACSSFLLEFLEIVFHDSCLW